MYLLYIGDRFFGNTRSKNVVKSFKKIYPTAHVIPCNEYSTMSFEKSYLVSDSLQVGHYKLKRADGSMVDIISTDDELSDATQWVNQFIFDKLSPVNIDIYERLPARYKAHLGEYFPSELYIMDSDSTAIDDGLAYELTYEGYILYLARDKRKDDQYGQTDLCMLPK